jgi:hypothetical protein
MGSTIADYNGDGHATSSRRISPTTLRLSQEQRDNATDATTGAALASTRSIGLNDVS